MRNFYFACIFLLPVIANAQHQTGLGLFYETVNAEKAAKRTISFNLEKDARFVEELLYRKYRTNPTDNDSIITTRYYFAPDGLLDSIVSRRTVNSIPNIVSYYETYEYDEQRRLKKSLMYNGGKNGSLVTKTFSEGFLVKQHVDRAAGEKDYTVIYSYNETHSAADIYLYYRRPFTGGKPYSKLQFTFDSLGRVLREVRTETDLPHTTDITYDQQSGLPIGIKTWQGHLWQQWNNPVSRKLEYNGNSRKILDSVQQPYTGKGFSFHVTSRYTYNANGDVVTLVQVYPSNNSPEYFTKSQPPPRMPDVFFDYEYTYDKEGNWTEREEYQYNNPDNKKLFSVVKRRIEYY